MRPCALACECNGNTDSFVSSRPVGSATDEVADKCTRRGCRPLDAGLLWLTSLLVASCFRSDSKTLVSAVADSTAVSISYPYPNRHCCK